MNCQKARELFPEYFLGDDAGRELSDAASDVRSHLATCVSCNQEAERLRDLWTKLGSVAEEPPGEALRANFYAMLEGYKQGMSHSKPAANWFAGLFYQPAFQAACAVVLLGVGLAAGHLLTARENGRGELAELRQEMRGMQRLVTLSMLQQQSASDRLQGVSWSQRERRPDPEVISALLQVVEHDPNVNVRLAALDALRPFSGQALVKSGLIQALGQQSTPMVQISMIDFVVETREQQAAVILKQMAADEKLHEVVRKRAEWGLERLNIRRPI